MRKAFLVPGLLALAVSVVHCGNKSQYDDDDNSSGSSGKGGKSTGQGGSTSAGSGHGGTSETAGESGTAANGSGGDASATGGSNATGGTHSTGGSHAAGGSDSVGGSATADGGALNEAGAAGVSGGTAGKGGSSGTGGASGAGGQSGSAGSGGKGGAGGTSGKGGSGGGSGLGGMGGGLACGPGQGLALTTEPGAVSGSGWIDASTDCVGIQGAVYVDSDIYGSSITLDSTDGHICVSGYSAQVLNGSYDLYWGARVSIQLNNPGDDTAHPYNATTHGVTGFAFSLSGALPPSIIRPTLQVSGSSTQYCESVCASGDQSMLVTDAESACYDAVTHTNPDATKLQLLQFYLPSNPDGIMEFEFCIDDLRALTTSTHVGDPGTCAAPATDSCVGHCSSLSSDGTCYCDSLCTGNGDCCADYAAACL